MAESIGEKLGKVVGQLGMVVPILSKVDLKVAQLEARTGEISGEIRNVKRALEEMAQELESARAKLSGRTWDVIKLLVAAGVGAAISYYMK